MAATTTPLMTAGRHWRLQEDLGGVRWIDLKRDLQADNFDNGRSADELRRSFEASYAVCFAVLDDRVMGTARVLSDGVCNAYLVDVWTKSGFRRQGVGTAMVASLLARLPGQHVGLFTTDHTSFYESLGFRLEPAGLSVVVGTWLNRAATDRDSAST